MRNIYSLAGLVLLVYGYFIMYVIAGSTRWFKNQVGKLAGWTNCPNCEDTFFHRKLGFLHYQPLNGEPKWQASLTICEDCAVNPSLLDEYVIAKNLLQAGWPPERVQLIFKAVIRSQNGEPNLYRLDSYCAIPKQEHA